ncbi:hypothetical protein BC828DRAFT_389401 [Blastocladiella britannica]|nr:hypothetical protein BC828DRAFT_389401 [Blastocladiella britannica]
MSNPAIPWIAAGESTTGALLDLYMLTVSINDWQQFSRRRPSKSQHGQPAWVSLLHIASWTMFLVADLAQVGSMIGFGLLDTCGEVPTLNGAPYQTSGGLFGRYYVKNCIITDLQAVYEYFGFTPIPVFPILYLRLVLQLEQLNPRRVRRALVACTVSEVLTMLLQQFFALYVFTGDFMPWAAQMEPYKYTVVAVIYNIHMALVLTISGSSITFMLRFLGILTARLADMQEALAATHSHPPMFLGGAGGTGITASASYNSNNDSSNIAFRGTITTKRLCLRRRCATSAGSPTCRRRSYFYWCARWWCGRSEPRPRSWCRRF